MTFDFSELFFGQSFFNKLQCVYPFVKFRIRDDITIKSKHCALNELGVFVLSEKDKRLAPKFAEAIEGGTEVNLLPLLCVGMCEFLLDQSVLNKTVMLEFEEVLLTRISKELVEYNLAEEFLHDSIIDNCVDNSNGFVLAHSLRYGHSHEGKIHSLKILGYLYFVACKLPKLFAEIFFDFMYVYMSTMRTYCDANATLIGYDDATGDRNYNVPKMTLDYKHYLMKTPRKTVIKLSNSRGLGLACLNLLVLYIIKDADRNCTLFKDDFIPVAESNFFAGLGEDITAKIILGKSVSVENTHRSFSEYIIFHPNRTYTVNNNSIVREVYEEQFLYRKAYGVSYNEGISELRNRDVSVHYFTADSFISSSSVIYTICAKNEVSVKKNIEILSRAKTEIDKYRRRINYLESALQKADDEKEKLKSKLVEDYEEKIKDLNFQLEQKSQINIQLSEKVASLNSRLSSFFCEDELEDDAEEVVVEITQEERLNYLNGFSFLLVGGREGLAQKLEDIGWTSITQISNSNSPVLSSDASSRPNIDFIVINTKFVSHNLVRAVESRFGDLSDRVIYFNGTNVDYLSRVTIDFIRKYMED